MIANTELKLDAEDETGIGEFANKTVNFAQEKGAEIDSSLNSHFEKQMLEKTLEMAKTPRVMAIRNLWNKWTDEERMNYFLQNSLVKSLVRENLNPGRFFMQKTVSEVGRKIAPNYLSLKHIPALEMQAYMHLGILKMPESFVKQEGEILSVPMMKFLSGLSMFSRFAGAGLHGVVKAQEKIGSLIQSALPKVRAQVSAELYGEKNDIQYAANDTNGQVLAALEKKAD